MYWIRSGPPSESTKRSNLGKDISEKTHIRIYIYINIYLYKYIYIIYLCVWFTQYAVNLGKWYHAFVWMLSTDALYMETYICPVLFQEPLPQRKPLHQSSLPLYPFKAKHHPFIGWPLLIKDHQSTACLEIRIFSWWFLFFQVHPHG